MPTRAPHQDDRALSRGTRPPGARVLGSRDMDEIEVEGGDESVLEGGFLEPIEGLTLARLSQS